MEKLKANIIKIYGSRGESWLAGLPHRVDQLRTAWGLSKLKPLSNLSYSYVLEGFQGKSPIVLKLSPDANLTDKEARTLDAFKGFGAVSVLGCKEGVLLLERAVPGSLLKNSRPKEIRIEIGCKVMERLHQAPLPSKGLFPHIKEWLAAIDKEWELPEVSAERPAFPSDSFLRKSFYPILLLLFGNS